MQFIKISLIYLLMISIFSSSKLLIASDFEYMGPSNSYKYSYSYINNEHAFDIVGDFFSDRYINKKIIYDRCLLYSLYIKNNSIMINGDFEEILIGNDKTWIQTTETYSIENRRSLSKYICNKYYRSIHSKYNILLIIKEGRNIVEEEVYLEKFGMILYGGYSKDFIRNLDDYAFVSIVDGESINGTYIEDIKKDIFNVLKEYDINRSTQQNIPN